jgi:hypothetical protein
MNTEELIAVLEVLWCAKPSKRAQEGGHDTLSAELAERYTRGTPQMSVQVSVADLVHTWTAYTAWWMGAQSSRALELLKRFAQEAPKADAVSQNSKLHKMMGVSLGEEQSTRVQQAVVGLLKEMTRVRRAKENAAYLAVVHAVSLENRVDASTGGDVKPISHKLQVGVCRSWCVDVGGWVGGWVSDDCVCHIYIYIYRCMCVCVCVCVCVTDRQTDSVLVFIWWSFFFFFFWL